MSDKSLHFFYRALELLNSNAEDSERELDRMLEEQKLLALNAKNLSDNAKRAGQEAPGTNGTTVMKNSKPATTSGTIKRAGASAAPTSAPSASNAGGALINKELKRKDQPLQSTATTATASKKSKMTLPAGDISTIPTAPVSSAANKKEVSSTKPPRAQLPGTTALQQRAINMAVGNVGGNNTNNNTSGAPQTLHMPVSPATTAPSPTLPMPTSPAGFEELGVVTMGTK